MPSPSQSATSTAPVEAPPEGLSAAEREAIKERKKELKAASRRGPRGAKPDLEPDVLAKIAEMPESDRVMAERVHAIVRSTAPDLEPKLWYGMPAYARAGRIVCFFQSADKFKARYATVGFDQEANLDDGNMWPTSWALTKLTAADEARIAELVRQAVG